MMILFFIQCSNVNIPARGGWPKRGCASVTLRDCSCLWTHFFFLISLHFFSHAFSKHSYLIVENEVDYCIMYHICIVLYSCFVLYCILLHFIRYLNHEWLTYLRKYRWPVDVKAISHPGGRGNSSATSKDCWRRWAWWAGFGVALAPVPNCNEAGEECDRACCTVSLGVWLPESVLDWRECVPRSGSLKNDSGSIFFLQELGFGFITELNSASRSVSRSCATWTTCCPGKGCLWLLIFH